MLIKDVADLFLLLVCWLRRHNKEIHIDETKQMQMVKKLLSFAWFDFGNVQKLWEEINDVDFWEKPLNQYMWWEGEHGIHFLLPPELLKKYYEQDFVEKLFLEHESENHQHRWGLWREGMGEQIKSYYENIKEQEFEWDKANEYFWKFIQKLQTKKQLILFAQRDYINSEFGDYKQMEDLEDTNIPWDWDHIYPSEWVYRKVYCSQAIKDWNGTTGNLRALSLEQNRRERNSVSPKERLDNESIRQKSFITDSDWKFWQQIEDRIRDDKKVENHFRAVITRMINIYEKFWNDLNINELIIYKN
jgi:hypothetical protein